MENWAGNVTFSPASIVVAESIEHLQTVVHAADAAGCRVGVVGAGHSFSPIADSDGVLVSTERLDRIDDVVTGEFGSTVTLESGVRLAALAQCLHAAGWAIHNLPSLTHLTVVGAVATGTHGSGDANPSLSAAVVAVDVIRPDGELVHLATDDHRFAATVVGLGVMGVVARLTLRVEPTFDISQTVVLDLPMAAAQERLHELLGLAYSVSMFTDWRSDAMSQVWIKQRAGELFDADALTGATAADRPMHPIGGVDAAACTDQSGRPGPWHERLPHFRPDHRPSAGAELQSECFVDQADAPAALATLRGLAPVLAPVVLVSEVRSIAADDLWLSMASGRDSVGFHFTWRPLAARVLHAVTQVERALEPFAPRPHWGKLTTMTPTTIRSRYDRFDEAMDVRRAGDPHGTFLNRYVGDIVAGGDS